MKNPFKRKKELKAEIKEIKKEKEKVHNKTEKIDKLSQELKEHLEENNIGKRVYEQWAQSWR